MTKRMLKVIEINIAAVDLEIVFVIKLRTTLQRVPFCWWLPEVNVFTVYKQAKKKVRT